VKRIENEREGQMTEKFDRDGREMSERRKTVE
jgi:hypothetical protein